MYEKSNLIMTWLQIALLPRFLVLVNSKCTEIKIKMSALL